MVSTFTPNIQLEEPARGDDVGTWDTPVNGNMTLVDLVAGGIATITLNNSPVVLSAAQFKCRQITFVSTLTGNVLITFPTSFTKDYEIQNLCTGSSAFNISLISNGLQIGAPPGEIVDVVNDGTNMKYKNLGRIGSYMDYAGASVPAWIANCGVPPYLNCDGASFSSATYPALTVVLGGTTLPDRRGTFGAPLNQGTGRITSGSGGVDGNTRFTVGGGQTVVLVPANLPAYTPTGTVAVTQTPSNPNSVLLNIGGPNLGGGAVVAAAGATLGITATFTGAAQGGVSQPISNMPPTTITGIVMIRAG